MALSVLVGCTPRDLIHKTTSNGDRLLADVLRACASDGLCKALFADDIDRLYTLFDVCCDNGLGAYVLDYVLSVCLDPAIASNDPLQSFMMDGACIVKWVERSLGDLRRTLLTTPNICSLAAAPAGTTTVLLRFLARLHTMHAALDALQGQHTLQHETALLQQLCKVTLWASGNQLQQQRALGVFASEQEWRSVVHKRREASGGRLFLDRLLHTLQQLHGVERCQYPPSSLDHALKDWFAHGSSTQAAATAKLQLLCYMLVDAGLVQPGAFARTGVLQMPGWQWQLTAGQCLVDSASLPGQEHVASQASAVLLAGAGQAVGAGHAHALDLQSLEQLSALGQHRAAVALLDTGVGTTQHVDDALRAQRLLLAQGRVTDALHRARSDAAALPDSGAEAVHALVGALLTWCRAHDRVAELLALPLTPPEEGAVLGALAPEVVESSARAVCDADAAVGYMLARGRVAEALLLARRVDAAVARGGLAAEVGQARAGLQQDLAAAVRRMPPAQAHVLVRLTADDVPGVRMATSGEDGVVAVAPNAAAVGGAPAAPVVVQGGGDGPVPLVSHVLAPMHHACPAEAVAGAAAPTVESMVFTDAPRALPMQTAAPAASMDDAVAALLSAAPSGTSRKHPSKRARLASHARAW